MLHISLRSRRGSWGPWGQDTRLSGQKQPVPMLVSDCSSGPAWTRMGAWDLMGQSKPAVSLGLSSCPVQPHLRGTLPSPEACQPLLQAPRTRRLTFHPSPSRLPAAPAHR